MNTEISGTLQNPQIKTKAHLFNTRGVESLDLTQAPTSSKCRGPPKICCSGITLASFVLLLWFPLS